MSNEVMMIPTQEFERLQDFYKGQISQSALLNKAGRLAAENHLILKNPKIPGHESHILNYERDWALAGCSGYVTYRMFDTDITIAFSNPSVGNNKLGVGTSGKRVWDYSSDHGYDKFTINVDTSNGKVKLQFDCKCTGGSTNICTVNI